MNPLLVTSGEPSGIGPDICLALANVNLPLVVLGDKSLLAERAKQLQLDIELIDYQGPQKNGDLINKKIHQKQLYVLSRPCHASVQAGQLNVFNAPYVLQMLDEAVTRCLEGEFSALITAPVHKQIINQTGIPFTGHTEFLADRCATAQVIMMFVTKLMNMAFVTTHLPLKMVSKTITQERIVALVRQLHHALQKDFDIKNPRIIVAGLNPHAGEGGYLGREELDIIQPALECLKNEGIQVDGPFAADTLFSAHHLHTNDIFLMMYHDQGLPVLKYASFGQAVNVTLGLSIVRTSVDHGTALELAGTGKADSGSLIAAVQLASMIAQRRALKGETH